MDSVRLNVEERIPYVILLVKNLERSVRFYHEDLGLLKRDFPLATKMGGVALAIQGTTLILLDESSAAGDLPDGSGGSGPAAGNCYPSFGVADLEAFHEAATARGVECAQSPRADKFGKFAVYRDPDGLLFSVVEAVKTAAAHAVVLSGGGALGAFELGVLGVLARDPAVPDPVIFTGTSVGGYNAAVLASEFTSDAKFTTAVERLTDIWRNRVAGGVRDNGVFRLRGDASRLLGGLVEPAAALLGDAAYLATDFTKRVANLATSSSAPWVRLMRMLDIAAIISTEPLEHLVKDTLPWERIRDSPRALKLATTNWVTGKLQLFVHDPNCTKRLPDETELTEQNAHPAVMASTAIPGLFPAVEIMTPCSTTYVDGGVVLNSPLHPAIDAGADVIHVICLNPDVNTLHLHPLSSTLDCVTRLLIASAAANVRTDLERARFVNSVAGVARRRSGELYRPVTVHRYHPVPGNLGGLAGMLDFSLGHLDALIGDGAYQAEHHDCNRSGCVIPEGRL